MRIRLFLMSAYCFKTNRIDVSGFSVSLSTRQYHVVAFGKSEYLFCFLHSMIEHHINGIELLTKNRSNAPAQDAFRDVVIPIISTGGLKRLTIRTVIPESELITIPFALVSIAIAQVAPLSLRN